MPTATGETEHHSGGEEDAPYEGLETHVEVQDDIERCVELFFGYVVVMCMSVCWNRLCSNEDERERERNCRRHHRRRR